MKFLIDTNILIPLEPTSPSDLTPKSSEAAEFARLASEAKYQLYIHPAQRKDLLRDKDQNRRRAREILVRKYIELPNPPASSPVFEKELTTADPKSHDWVDLQLLIALERNAIDVLVTEDVRLRKKAERYQLEGRVLALQDAIAGIRNLIEKLPPPPAVLAILAYSLNERDPIFDSFREDYGAGFDAWLEKCKREHRQAWIIMGDGQYAGVAIANPETKDQLDLEGNILKICTFKISQERPGFKLGELMLKAVFRHALTNKFNGLYVTVFPKYETLISFFQDFGFRPSRGKTSYGELKLTKPILLPSSDTPHGDTLSPLDFNIRYGPAAIKSLEAPAYFIPIQPKYHRLLFPEAENQQELMPGRYPFGNSIRKAYLCNAGIRSIGHGSTILFYRSHDTHGITAVGVVEHTMVSSDSNEVARYVIRRTVYSQDDIDDMCSTREVLAILFRHAGLLPEPILLADLRDNRALARAPQSIQSVPQEAIEWLHVELKQRLRF